MNTTQRRNLGKGQSIEVKTRAKLLGTMKANLLGLNAAYREAIQTLNDRPTVKALAENPTDLLLAMSGIDSDDRDIKFLHEFNKRMDSLNRLILQFEANCNNDLNVDVTDVDAEMDNEDYE